MNDHFEMLRELHRRYHNLDYTPQRAAVNREYVALADQLARPYEQASGRYDLAWAYAMGDDPAKALPVCAEFFALLEQHPRILGEDTARFSVCAAMIAFYVATCLPQIPLEQCTALLEQFRQQMRKFGLGERLWQMHACHFRLMTGDREGATEHLARFYAAPRDQISDCAACEAGNAAEFLLKLGRREEAMKLVQPVLERRLTCEQQPWSVLSVLIHDALDRGELETARGYGRRLTLRRLQSPGDLPWAGAMMRLEAGDGGGRWSDPGKLTRCLTYVMDLWDQNLLFRLYLGAAAYCGRLSREQGTVRLTLPPKFPAYQESGLYDCSALAQWCRDQAGDIGRRFDARNGTRDYDRALAAALAEM